MSPNILALASYFKGERFLRQAHARGARVYLLTLEKLLAEPWPREVLDGVFAQAGHKPHIDDTIRTVAYLSRTHRFDRIVALDDFDVETAATLREHFRLPGMGDTTARFFRDKLAMRTRARDGGVPVPDFTGVFNHDDVRAFCHRTPAPWMNKPRSQASAAGITKVTSEQQLWHLLEEQGDQQSFHLLEQFVPGDIYHVDSIVAGGKVAFSEAHKCLVPPFDVAHTGGVFASYTLDRDGADARELRAMNEQVLSVLGLAQGAAHVEFIRARDGGQLYFLEVGARVGGAHIAEMVEAATGVNPWEAWADCEMDGPAWKLPAAPRREYGGLLMTLAREEHPDLSSYDDPEVVYRAPEKHHAGLVVRAASEARAKELVARYADRFREEITVVLPAAKEPGH